MTTSNARDETPKFSGQAYDDVLPDQGYPTCQGAVTDAYGAKLK
jgi:hypothetical protein